MSPSATYILCAIGGLISVVGDLCFKRWADHNAALSFLAGLAMYVIGAVVWAIILRRGTTLSMGATIWFATALLLALTAGIVVYGDRPTCRQCLGAAFVLLGLVLSY